MNDPTELIRRAEVNRINSEVESDDENAERKRLEGIHSKVWNTDEMSSEFEAIGFMAPYIVVKRKSDGKKGSLEFQHMPRFYFNFMTD
jgi:hypothetical protein